MSNHARTASFQFHKGTIKTRLRALYLRAYRDFNSIKVQLKPSKEAEAVAAALFQFHKGTIKTTL